MSDKDLEETIEGLRELTKELIADPARAHAFFVEMGLITPDGQLTEHYR